MMYDLKRFIVAQDPAWQTAKQEIMAGAKKSHWMWFIFPQLASLGLSPRSIFYGLSGKEEAVAYDAHPILGDRLRYACYILLRLPEDTSALQIFGEVDAEKLRSCLTLFSQVPNQPIYRECLSRYFEGPDSRTLQLLGM